MQDAAQGFRTTDIRQVGQVTSWPCSLGVSAAWDVDLMESWGKALGAEHRAKGANVILGPSINVHRVAKGGRNAEYISGESPALGSMLTPAYVRGVQGAGVMAVAKVRLCLFIPSSSTCSACIPANPPPHPRARAALCPQQSRDFPK